MKISTQGINNSKKQKVFHPFNIVLTIEDESDLEDLAVRFNADENSLNEECTYNGYKAKGSYGVWEDINTLLSNKPYMK